MNLTDHILEIRTSLFGDSGLLVNNGLNVGLFITQSCSFASAGISYTLLLLNLYSALASLWSFKTLIAIAWSLLFFTDVETISTIKAN